MTIRGEGGALRVGYQCAARLGTWTLKRVHPHCYEATATLVDADTFWITHGPFDLDLTIGQRAWSWVAVQPNVMAESLTVTLEGVPSIH